MNFGYNCLAMIFYQETFELLPLVGGEGVLLCGGGGVGVGVGAEEVVGVGELSVDEGELVDRGGHAEAGDVGGEELLVQRVSSNLRLQLPLLVIWDRTFDTHHGKLVPLQHVVEISRERAVSN